MPVAELRGLVLAGGDSRRMGTDKAALRLGQATLLEHAVAVLTKALADNPDAAGVFVSVRSGDPMRRQFACIPDSLHVRGPAAGLLSAHLKYPESAWLVLACDMPRVGADLLRDLLLQRDPAAPATCWWGADGLPEPLCAVWEPATLAAFLRSVRGGGHLSPREWLRGSGAKHLELTQPGVLQSANTPEDWQQLRDRHD